MNRLLPPILLGALIVFTSIRAEDYWWSAAMAFALGILGAMNLKRPWSWKAITFALPLLGFLTALWAGPVVALFIGAVLWASFLCFTGRFPWARLPAQAGTEEERGMLGITLFVFVLFLNFFTFRSNFPMFSGLASIAALAGVFFAINARLSGSFALGGGKRVETLVLTFLLTEAVYFLYFLPSGYFTLAVASTIWYFATVDLYVKLTVEPQRPPKTLLAEMAGALLLILMVIVSSGFHAR